MSQKYNLAHLNYGNCQECLAKTVAAAAAATTTEAATSAVVTQLTGTFGSVIQEIIAAIKAGASNLPAVLAIVGPLLDNLAPQYATYIDLVIMILLKLFSAAPVAPAPAAPAPAAPA